MIRNKCIKEMKILFATFVACLLASSVSADSLCVATYNVNYANRRGDQVLDAISKAKADLICFQETTVQSEMFLKEKLADTHPHFYSVGHNGHYLAERFAFASKTELTDIQFTAPEAGLFGFYKADLVFNNEQIQIVNVHLTPFQFKRGAGAYDALAALAGTEKNHADEIDVIVKAIDFDRPAIVLGDFNSISTMVAPQRLLKLGMIDAFAILHEDADRHPTWRWPTRPIPLTFRIDYIFHSEHFTATESQILRREGSDHSMLYAVLTRREQSDVEREVKSQDLPIDDRLSPASDQPK